MRQRAMLLTVVAGFLIAGGASAYWVMGYEPGADRSYDTDVEAPALKDRHPVVFFDSGHHNVHSIRGRYGPFARLMESDGCQVRAIGAPLTRGVLSEGQILVI